MTTDNTLKLLVVEDSEDDFELLQLSLRSVGYTLQTERVETSSELRQALKKQWDLVISDHHLPRFSSWEAMKIIKENCPDLPFLILSGTIGEDLAVEAMHAGADDYIMKDKPGRLVPSIRRALETAETRRRRRDAELSLQESEARFRGLASNLPGMVFQMQYSKRGGRLQFPYVSAGSQRLFGLAPELLSRNPSLFFDLLDPVRQPDFLALLKTANDTLLNLRWQGSTNPDMRLATKWIEIAASPRETIPGEVMWDGIVMDITLQKEAEMELRSSQQQLRELASHIVKVKEEERESIARDLHDDVGSAITAIKYDLAWLKDQSQSDEKLVHRLQKLDKLADSAAMASSRIVRDLRPPILDYGIVASLEWLTRDFRQRLNIRCNFNCSTEEIELSRDAATAVFRIVQEALNNITKHAGADRVQLWLEAKTDTLHLEIGDNGKGLGGQDMQKQGSFGLRGMKERALQLGGALDILSTPNEGTVIKLTLPLAVNRESATGS